MPSSPLPLSKGSVRDRAIVAGTRIQRSTAGTIAAAGLLGRPSTSGPEEAVAATGTPRTGVPTMRASVAADMSVPAWGFLLAGAASTATAKRTPQPRASERGLGSSEPGLQHDDGRVRPVFVDATVVVACRFGDHACKVASTWLLRRRRVLVAAGISAEGPGPAPSGVLPLQLPSQALRAGDRRSASRCVRALPLSPRLHWWQSRNFREVRRQRPCIAAATGAKEYRRRVVVPVSSGPRAAGR
jgi:hypothetical protein